MEITLERFKELQDAESKLIALENGGVDNWEHYGEAMRSYNEEKEKEEKFQLLLESLEEAFLDGAYEPSERGAGFSSTNEGREKAETLIKNYLKNNS